MVESELQIHNYGYMKKEDKNNKLYIQAQHCIEGKVLDVGFSANPNPYLKNVAGIDIKLPKVKPDNYFDVKECNLNYQSIPYPNNEFSNVIAGDIIEHVENPSQFLREVNRVLKVDGRLIISTPQANDWWTTLHNWFFRRWINDPDPGEHLQNWTFLDMIRILKKNGFVVEKIEGFYMHFPKIHLRIRVKNIPMLSWQVFYIAKRAKDPDQSILVNIDNEWHNVEK